MTFLGYLKKEDILELFLMNISNRNPPLTPDTEITNAFTWSYTPEGHAFWEIHDIYCNRNNLMISEKEIEELRLTFPEYFL